MKYKMAKSKKQLSRKTKLELLVATLIVVILGGYVTWDITQNGPIMQFFSNTDALRQWVEGLGVFGPIAFILLQFVQTVVAPIPGNVVGILGGLIFGLWGILYSLIGSTFGYWAVFFISRRFGRPLVEKIVKKESLDKFDFITDRRGSLILFLIFLVPGLPDDVVCYIAGLSEIPIRHLMAMVVIGRLPAAVGNNLIGSGLSGGNYTLVIIFTVIIALMVAVIYLQQERVLKLLGLAARQDSRIQKLEQNIDDLADDGKINQSTSKK